MRRGQRDHDDIETATHQLLDKKPLQRLAQFQFEDRDAGPGVCRQQLAAEWGAIEGMTPNRSVPFRTPLRCRAKSSRSLTSLRMRYAAPGDFDAEFRQRHIVGASLHQSDPEILLHLLDLHGQSRLVDGGGIGRASEMQVPGQGIEITKLPESVII